ncbi:MAG: hypothetical protein IPI00_12380 [Flavobacteriales bacterium]|nr:hypothetical protein [Flavobacteriales bacterium]
MTLKLTLLLLLFPILAFQLRTAEGDPWKAPPEADALVDPLAHASESGAERAKDLYLIVLDMPWYDR